MNEEAIAQKKNTPKSHRTRGKANPRFASTYVFNGYLRGEYSEAISSIRETVAQMQRDGNDIEFLGATQEINGAGQLIELTAHYAAPSKGTVGLLNWRACLPASGPPQREDAAEIEAGVGSFP